MTYTNLGAAKMPKAGRIMRSLLSLVVAVGLLQAPANTASAEDSPELTALIKAAKEEGSVFFYASMIDADSRRLAKAFSEKYDIDTQFIRLSGTNAKTRYATEAETGTFAADLLYIAGANIFAKAGVEKGWLQPVADANLPVVKNAIYPATQSVDDLAIIQYAPWIMVYNTDTTAAADIPTDWTDVLDPKYKGQILIADPRASDVYLHFWAALADRYGASFFEKLRAQELRLYKSGVPAIQALGAGEGLIQFPAIPIMVAASKSKGAPVELVQMDYTTAVEMQVLLTNPEHSKHPNAARLLANYSMTPEGNAILNGGVGGISVFDTTNLPAELQPTLQKTIARKQEIYDLLGL